jgi:hypothetical protein
MGARAWLAHTQRDLAATLLDAGDPTARPRALALLRSAGETARALGMTRLAAAVERAMPLDCDAGADPEQEGGAWCPAVPAQSVLRHEGEYWTVAFEGRVFRLRNTKGLLLLAYLLRHPRREFHACDLVLVADTPGAGGECGVPPASAAQLAEEGLAVGDPRAGFGTLDRRAKAAYRARLAELGGELEDARACRDAARVIRAQEEIDFLTHELARSFGVDGRARRAGSVAERARLNVTRAIRSAVARIAAHHPALGEHLARTVKTGMFCCYALDPRAAISWLL